MVSAISMDDVKISHPGKEASRNIGFSIALINVIGIIGPNRAGKSMLLKAMLILISVDKGSIAIFGKPLQEVRKRIAYLPQ